jgi:nucleotide-binding universal stress UspA family protein
MRVLVAIDDSDCSRAAFDSVRDRSWPGNVEFRLITVVSPVFAQCAAGCGYSEAIFNAQQEYTEYCRELIDRKIKQLQTKFVISKVTGAVLEGNIPDCILSDAAQFSADLIVVGSHGRKGFEKFFLGSVAERVATHSPCSVEIIRQKQVPAKNTTNAKKRAVLV